MKPSKSGLYLLLAALLIFASIPLATRGLAGTDIPIAIGRGVVALIFVLWGLYMVATVLRVRLVIEDSQIRWRGVFREKVSPLSEIEGVRTIIFGPASRRLSRRVICVRGRRTPIETIMLYGDDFLPTWLQQLPNLDQPGQAGSSSVDGGTGD